MQLKLVGGGGGGGGGILIDLFFVLRVHVHAIEQ